MSPEAKYYAGIILVGIFISLPGWLLVFSNPVIGGGLIIFSIILQQLMIRAAKKHKYNRSVKLDNGEILTFKSRKECVEYAKQYEAKKAQVKPQDTEARINYLERKLSELEAEKLK